METTEEWAEPHFPIAVSCLNITMYWKATEHSVKKVLIVLWYSLLTGVIKMWEVLDGLKEGCNAVSKSAERRAASEWET